ncbi:MAG: PDZ domain-containing protein, partial [Ornithinimicrobium sp.]
GGLGPGGSIGLGFAIPSAQVARTARSLIETGTSDHPVIGVFVDLAYSGEGARVQRESDAGTDPVVSGGPADEAGVEPGDVILAIDGDRIADGSDLIVTLRAREIGEDVELLVRSQDGEERTLTMTLRGASQ